MKVWIHAIRLVHKSEASCTLPDPLSAANAPHYLNTTQILTIPIHRISPRRLTSRLMRHLPLTLQHGGIDEGVADDTGWLGLILGRFLGIFSLIVEGLVGEGAWHEAFAILVLSMWGRFVPERCCFLYLFSKHGLKCPQNLFFIIFTDHVRKFSYFLAFFRARNKLVSSYRKSDFLLWINVLQVKCAQLIGANSLLTSNFMHWELLQAEIFPTRQTRQDIIIQYLDHDLRGYSIAGRLIILLAELTTLVMFIWH